MPGQFPVYLRLPYRRDSYFCFRQQAKQAAFLSILSDCIRHQNQGEASETENTEQSTTGLLQAAVSLSVRAGSHPSDLSGDLSEGPDP